MDLTGDEPMTLEDRILALESSARRWRRCAVALVLCAVVAGCLGAGQKAVSDVVKTKRVEVVDADGTVRALISASRGWGEIELTESLDRQKTHLTPYAMGTSSVMNKETQMTLLNPGGVTVRDNNTHVMIWPDRVFIGPSASLKTPPEEFYKGNPLKFRALYLGLSKDGSGVVEVRGPTPNSEKPLVRMSVDKNGGGEIGIWDRKGKGRTLTPNP